MFEMEGWCFGLVDKLGFVIMSSGSVCGSSKKLEVIETRRFCSSQAQA